MWHFIASIDSVPAGQRVQLAVVDQDGLDPLVFPCCRIENYWIHAETEVQVEVHPTHWRDWSEQ